MKKIFNLGYVVAASLLAAFAIPVPALADQEQRGFDAFNLGSVFKMTDLAATIQSVINIMLVIAGVVAVIYLIIGGYQYVTAGGNAEQAAAARTTILNALIGLIVIFSAFAIVNFVLSNFLRGSSSPIRT
ncbi:MAG: pilin [Patescibacteria group bacterium]|jgi:hypothetical protein|nr:pilin [Patescibacteria group bacterium]